MSSSPNRDGARPLLPGNGAWRHSSGDGRRGAALCRYDGRVMRVFERASRGVVGWAAVLAWALAVSACSAPPPEPITFIDRAIIVENLTTEEWQNVEVWLNDHYRVTKSRMPPGERFSIPFSAFVAGFGQRFDAARQPIRGVEVNATAPGGQKVRIVWGAGRRR